MWRGFPTCISPEEPSYRRLVKVVEADPSPGFVTLMGTAVPGGNLADRPLPVNSTVVLLLRVVGVHAVVSVPMKTWTPTWKPVPVISMANGRLSARTRVMVGAAVAGAEETTMEPFRTLLTPPADAVIDQPNVATDVYACDAFCVEACMPSPKFQS